MYIQGSEFRDVLAPLYKLFSEYLQVQKYCWDNPLKT